MDEDDVGFDIVRWAVDDIEPEHVLQSRASGLSRPRQRVRWGLEEVWYRRLARGRSCELSSRRVVGAVIL
jgi:hypothetical protein